MLLSGYKLKLPRGYTGLKAGANLGIGDFAHAATQCVTEEVALVGHSLALEAAVAGKGDGLAGDELRKIRCALGGVRLGTVVCICYDSIGLIAEFGSELAMRCEYLCRRLNQLFVTSRVGRDFCGLVAVEATLLHAVAYLLASLARGI
jgi:hypothetical protein